MANEYVPGPTRAEVEAMEQPVVLEFGTGWCGFCLGAQSAIAQALATRPQLRHIKVEDGPGRPLGRSYRVKLWPTLIAVQNGQEVGRVVRPASATAVSALLDKLP